LSSYYERTYLVRNFKPYFLVIVLNAEGKGTLLFAKKCSQNSVGRVHIAKKFGLGIEKILLCRTIGNAINSENSFVNCTEG